jgi:hypothetical protein
LIVYLDVTMPCLRAGVVGGAAGRAGAAAARADLRGRARSGARSASVAARPARARVHDVLDRREVVAPLELGDLLEEVDDGLDDLDVAPQLPPAAARRPGAPAGGRGARAWPG